MPVARDSTGRPDGSGTPDPSRIRCATDLGRELTLARERAGKTIRQLAKETHLLPSTLGGYFSGRHRPPLDALDKVLDACGVPAGEREPWREAALALRRTPRTTSRPCPYPGLESFQPEDAGRFHGRVALSAAVLTAVDAGGGPLVVVGASGSGKSSLLRAGVVAALRARTDTTALVITPGRAPLAALAALADRPAVLVVDQFEEVFAPAVPEADRLAFVDALVAAPAQVVLGLRADFYAHALAHPALAAALQERQVVVGTLGPEELRAAVLAPATDVGATVEDALVDLLVADTQRHGSAGGLPLLAHALLATWQRGAMTVAGYRATGGVEGAIATSAEEAVAALGPDRLDDVRRLFLRLVTVAPDAADTRRRCDRAELPPAVTAQVLDEFVRRRLLVVDTGTVEITHEALIDAWPRLRGWLDADRAGAITRRRTAEAAHAWRDAGEDPELLLRGGRLVGAREVAAADLNELEAAFLAAGERREREQIAERRRRTRRLRQLVAALGVLALAAGALATVSAVQAGQIGAARDVAVSRQVAVRADALRAEDPALAAQLAVAAYRIAPTAEARASLLNSTAASLPSRMVGFAGLTSTVAVDRERRVLVSASGDAVQVWSLAAGGIAPAGPPIVAEGPVAAVALSADGSALAVGTGDGAVTHDLTDPGRPGDPLRIANGAVTALVLGPAGPVIAGADGVTLARTVLPGAPATVGALAVSPGGTVAVADGTGQVLVWPDVSAAPVPLSGPTGRVPALAFSPDGRILLAGSTDRSVYRFDLTDPARPQPLPPLTGPTNWVNAVAVSPDGGSVAVGSSDGTARVFDAATGRETASFPHPAPVVVTAFTGDGTLATATADGTGYRWQVRGPVLGGFSDAVFALDFDASGERLAIGPGSKDGTASLWTTAGRPLGPPVVNPEGEPSFSGSAALTPDGATLAVGRSDGSVRLWDVTTPAAPASLGEPLAATGQLVEQLVISPDGRRLAASGDDNTVRLWDIGDPSAPVAQVPLVGAKSFVFASTFNPDGTLLAAASADTFTYLWDVRNPAAPRLLATLDGPESFAYSAAFTPDGRTLAVGSADRSVRLYDVTDPSSPRRLGEPLTGPANYVYSVAFSPDGGRLAAASTDGTIWTWDTTDVGAPSVSAVLTGPTDAAFSVAWSPDGRTLAAGSADRTVRLWSTDTGEAMRLVCAGAGAALDPEEWSRHVPDQVYVPPC